MRPLKRDQTATTATQEVTDAGATLSEIEQHHDRLTWVQQERERHNVYRRKEKDYWSTRVCGDANHPWQLWRSLNTLMGASEKNTLPKNCP